MWVQFLFLTVMQASLKQWIPPGFCGRIALFDLWNAVTLRMNHKKIFCASVLLVKFIIEVILWYVFSLLKVLKSWISFSLQSILAAVSHLLCMGIERNCYFGNSLTYRDNCTKHFTVCIVLSQYFTQSFLREAQDILFTYFRKRNRVVEEIREPWQGNLSQSGINQQIKMSSFRSFNTYD